MTSRLSRGWTLDRSDLWRTWSSTTRAEATTTVWVPRSDVPLKSRRSSRSAIQVGFMFLLLLTSQWVHAAGVSCRGWRWLRRPEGDSRVASQKVDADVTRSAASSARFRHRRVLQPTDGSARSLHVRDFFLYYIQPVTHMYVCLFLKMYDTLHSTVSF